MKKLLCTIAALMITASAFGQGTVLFNNRLPVSGDQRIYLGGTEQLRGDALNSMGLPGPGPGHTAGLFLVTGGTVANTPLVTAAFRSTPAPGGFFFISPPASAVMVDGVAPNTAATFVIRAWANEAGSWAGVNPTVHAHGESAPFTVTLGGNVEGQPAIPAPYMEGLQEFNLFVVPEPSTIALGVLGAAALLLRRRK